MSTSSNDQFYKKSLHLIRRVCDGSSEAESRSALNAFARAWDGKEMVKEFLDWLESPDNKENISRGDKIDLLKAFSARQVELESKGGNDAQAAKKFTASVDKILKEDEKTQAGHDRRAALLDYIILRKEGSRLIAEGQKERTEPLRREMQRLVDRYQFKKGEVSALQEDRDEAIKYLCGQIDIWTNTTNQMRKDEIERGILEQCAQYGLLQPDGSYSDEFNREYLRYCSEAQQTQASAQPAASYAPPEPGQAAPWPQSGQSAGQTVHPASPMQTMTPPSQFRTNPWSLKRISVGVGKGVVMASTPIGWWKLFFKYACTEFSEDHMLLSTFLLAGNIFGTTAYMLAIKFAPDFLQSRSSHQQRYAVSDKLPWKEGQEKVSLIQVGGVLWNSPMTYWLKTTDTVREDYSSGGYKATYLCRQADSQDAESNGGGGYKPPDNSVAFSLWNKLGEYCVEAPRPQPKSGPLYLKFRD